MGLPKAKNRGGRPRKKKIKPGDRVPIGLRVTPETKAKIDAAAEASGRSQSQEIEFRLERSFDQERMLPELLLRAYGRQLAGLLMVLGEALKLTIAAATARTLATEGVTEGEALALIGRGLRDGNLSDPFVFREAMEAAVAALNYLDPAASRPAADMPSEQYTRIAGGLTPEEITTGVLTDVLEVLPNDARFSASHARTLLGDIATRFVRRNEK